MNMKRFLALLLAVVLVAGLAACGGKDTASTDGFTLNVNIASEPETIDPALNTTSDGGILISHAFEGLMTWRDDGQGNAVLENGAITDYTKGEIAEDGTVTYVFNLREDAKWSDGQPVVAEDFVYGLQRLLDPKTASEYNYMADMIVNAQEIMDSEAKPEELAVKAIDEHTLEIVLTYDCPYFLELVAFPALMPVRKDIVEANGDQWSFKPETYVGNGPMKMSTRATQDNITFVRNPEYHTPDVVKVDTLVFHLMDDQNAMLSGFKNGDLDFIKEAPVDEIPGLIESGEMEVLDHVGTYFVAFNTEAEPFDDPLVREAFSLVINRNFIVENITRSGQAPATGFVPAGVYDAEGAAGKDFRTNGGDYYSAKEEDYAANIERAKELMKEAGYEDGEGFPIVEYIYNTSDNHKAIGEALQEMWQKNLGVTVTISNQDWNIFSRNRKEGEYQIARHGWIADYNDPISFLDMWITGGGNNDANYSSEAYDAAIDEAKSTDVAKDRMAAMHKAEDILMKEDAVLAPIYYYKEKSMLRDGLDGMFYTPLGYFFFYGIEETAA